MTTHLQDLGEALAETGASPIHLIVAEIAGSFDVIAIAENNQHQEGFPLPPELHHAIITVAEKHQLSATWMHASFSMIVAQEKLPDDFFETAQDTHHGELLHLTHLSRAGQKYLTLFEAVHRESTAALQAAKALKLSQSELLKVTRWLRTQGLLENRHGNRLTQVLSQLTTHSASPDS